MNNKTKHHIKMPAHSNAWVKTVFLLFVVSQLLWVDKMNAAISAIQQGGQLTKVQAFYDKNTQEITITNGEPFSIVLFWAKREILMPNRDKLKVEPCGLRPTKSQGDMTLLQPNMSVIFPLRTQSDIVIYYTDRTFEKKTVTVLTERDIRVNQTLQNISKEETEIVESNIEIPNRELSNQIVQENQTPSPVTTNRTTRSPQTPSTTERQPTVPAPPITDAELKNFETSVKKLEDAFKKFDLKTGTNELNATKNSANTIKRRLEEARSNLNRATHKTRFDKCDELLKRINALIPAIDARIDALIQAAMKEVEEAYKKDVLADCKSDLLLFTQLSEHIDKMEANALWGWVDLCRFPIKDDMDRLVKQKELLFEKNDRFMDKMMADNKYKNVGALMKDALSAYIPSFYDDIDLYQDKLEKIKPPYVTLFIIGLMILLFIAGIMIYISIMLRNKKLKTIEKQKNIERGRELFIIEDNDFENIAYLKGLDGIIEKSGIDYLEIDMLELLKDTAIHKIYLSRQCILDIYKFFSNFLKLSQRTEETGCFLIGRWDYASENNQYTYHISLEKLVEPSDDAVYGEYELDFGVKIGISMQYTVDDLRKQSGKEYVHTAWMHSHPGLGLFLSKQDIIVQSQLAYSNHRSRMLAIVLDTNTPDLNMAFFTYKMNGVMNNNTDIKEPLSLEAMYQWAKRSPKANPMNINRQNYYEINFRKDVGKINIAFISGAAIIESDEFIVPEPVGVKGYLYGTELYKEYASYRWIIVDSFKEEKIETDVMHPIGCFIVVSDFSFDETIETYLSDMNDYDFVVVYSVKNGAVYMIVKGNQEQFDADNIMYVPLVELKAWTRRRR